MKNIVLVGFMGSGKTSIGKKLAEEAGSLFIDTDEWIEQQEGVALTQLFDEKGEAYFRNAETEILKELNNNEEPCVLSTGGGMVLKEENIQLMKQIGTIIYLKTSPEVIAKRLEKDTTRPLLKGQEPLGKYHKIKEILDKREGLYESAADLIILTDYKAVEDIVEEIEGCL